MKPPIIVDWEEVRGVAPRVLCLVALAFVLACSVFACAASLTLLALDSNGPFPASKLVLRIVLFAALAGGTVLLLWYCFRRPFLYTPTGETEVPIRGGALSFLLPLAFAATLVLPRLGAYPWAAPDEVHHLLVARNLAIEGLYASGHPATELRRFDTYDSVGLPVIGPVAATFRLTGVGTVHARIVMAGFFLALCVILFVLLSPLYGSVAVACALAMMTAGWGSVYLARTLYGEVPAFMFLAVGLWFWRKALQTPRPVVEGVLCGLAFGLAVLTKTILVLCAFPLLGVLVYDRLTFRRIRWPHVVLPSIAAACVVGAWWAVQAAGHHDVSGGAETTLAVYRHNLMFGVRSVPAALAAIPQGPLTALALLLGTLSIFPRIFARRYDPALAALFLIAAFFAFWWLFFTPARLPRYMWMSLATAGMFSGILMWNALVGAGDLVAGKGGNLKRLVWLVVALVVAVPGAIRVGAEYRRVYTWDEMGDDYAAAEYVRALPVDVKVGTTWRPLAGTLLFLADRPVDTLETAPSPVASNTVVFVDQRSQKDVVAGREPSLRIGHYAVFAGRDVAREGKR